MSSSQQGLALMLVIWVLAIFMAVAMSFSYATRNETSATLVFREASEERLLAESCMERAIAEIMLGRATAVAPVDESARAWRADGSRYRIEFASGSYCECIILADGGKIDVNKASDVLVKNLLGLFGLPEKDVNEVVDSLLDWRDPDTLVRLNGAEDDYYQSLPVPYAAKNADFESVEELLLVRGMTRDILYGTANRPGLADFVTVYSDHGKINIIVAPREVLLSLPGMTTDFADAILALRKAKQNVTLQDIQALLGNQYLPMSPYIGTGVDSVFSIEAVGRKHERKAGYAVKAVIAFSSVGGAPKYLYYRSPWETVLWKKSI